MMHTVISLVLKPVKSQGFYYSASAACNVLLSIRIDLAGHALQCLLSMPITTENVQDGCTVGNKTYQNGILNNVATVCFFNSIS